MMTNQAVSVTKKIGRPPKAPTVVVRLPEALVAKIDAWAEKQGVTRPEAIRAMIEAAERLGGLD